LTSFPDICRLLLVTRRRKPSRQTLQLLGAMLLRPDDWRYGYDLSKETKLQPGTLYPLLMRLADEGLLQSEWRPAARPGLPARHAYRLTPAGGAFARAALDEQGERPARLAPA
jgi:PadR family transcriptional regulator, regulatory protein PadR